MGCPAPYATRMLADNSIVLTANKTCTDVPLGFSIHRCYAFTDELTINPYGAVTGCCYMGKIADFHVGNLKDSSLLEIINSPAFKEKQQNQRAERCLDCTDSFCDGKCMIHKNENPFCSKNEK